MNAIVAISDTSYMIQSDFNILLWSLQKNAFRADFYEMCLSWSLSFKIAVLACTSEKEVESSEKGAIRRHQDRGQVLRRSS